MTFEQAKEKAIEKYKATKKHHAVYFDSYNEDEKPDFVACRDNTTNWEWFGEPLNGPEFTTDQN